MPGGSVEKMESGKGLPPLTNADKYERIVTRFAPNPDFVLHLGSLRAIILSHDYAQMYRGSFLLRFEDTDPRLKKSSLEYYEAIREDLRWMDCSWRNEYIMSDRLSIYYEYAEKLLAQGDAYVCTCEREAFRALINAGHSCPCRPKNPPENLRQWHQMLDGSLQEGEAVVRIKTETTHPNPAVRDWPAFRVIDPYKYPHPRVGSKYWVWPLYNMSAAVDDHVMGITHIFRGKEHLTNALRQSYLYKFLGWAYPEAVHYGRLKTVGFSLSKSLMVKKLEEGLVNGFSDPRLPTLAALRRRGYSPNALRKIVYELGPRPVDATLSWDNIDAVDRKEIDKIAHRYNFVPDPLILEVTGVIGSFTAHLPLHPEQPELGNRTLKVDSKAGKATLFLSDNDRGLLAKSKVIRLMELFNVEIESAERDPVKAKFHSKEYGEAKALRAPLVQWLPETQHLPCNVLLPNASQVSGLVEQNVLSEPVGSVIQMVRFGFGRIDNKSPSGLSIYFSHR